ncbi:MAG: hypothetical protein F2534_15040 [Actinobacteria bacterium]|nr:hypothetical protein [Actinomycetota bacterium]
MTDHDDELDERARYLAALEELRSERDDLHPHHPVLTERHLSVVPPPRDAVGTLDATDPDDQFRLDPRTVELGRQRIAELRDLIARNRATRRSTPA